MNQAFIGRLRRNQNLDDLGKTESALTKIVGYRNKSVWHIDRLQRNRLPKFVMKYRPSVEEMVI
jgi:hypothetical protein